MNDHKRVLFEDGFSVSVMPVMGTTLYVELGFPSSHEELLEEYEEFFNSWEPHTNAVFIVPSSMVFALQRKHGEIVEGSIPRLGFE